MPKIPSSRWPQERVIFELSFAIFERSHDFLVPMEHWRDPFDFQVGDMRCPDAVL